MPVCPMHACVRMHACMHACINVRTYVCMHVCMFACMHVCMYACMCLCRLGVSRRLKQKDSMSPTDPLEYVHIHLCMCVYKYIHVYLHTHMYTCMYSFNHTYMYECIPVCMYPCMFVYQGQGTLSTYNCKMVQYIHDHIYIHTSIFTLFSGLHDMYAYIHVCFCVSLGAFKHNCYCFKACIEKNAQLTNTNSQKDRYVHVDEAHFTYTIYNAS